MAEREYSHYFKDVAGLDVIDVYRVLDLFRVTDPCIQHAVKKLLVAGGRGAGKDISQDIKEAIDTLRRWQEMRNEDAERLLDGRTHDEFPMPGGAVTGRACRPSALPSSPPEAKETQS